MGNFHWLLLIGFYFFTSLTCLLALTVISRLVRASVAVNTLVMTSISVSFIAILVPLLTGWARLTDYSGTRLLMLGVASFILAAIDLILQRWLPLPLDEELAEL